MDMVERRARMFKNLERAEATVRAAEFEVTARAELFIEAGAPLTDVLGALGISRATWYRRVEALRNHEEAVRSAPGGTYDQLGI